MQVREQMITRLAKAYAEAKKVSQSLKALAEKPVIVNKIKIPETTPAWKKQNLNAAEKIDDILENTDSLKIVNPEVLTNEDLEKLAFELENISENFRFNTDENKKADASTPGYVYSPETNAAYREALRNSSVPHSYMLMLDAVGNSIASVITKATEQMYGNEISFEDSEEEPMPTEYTEKTAARLQAEEALHKKLDEATKAHQQKKAAEPPQKPVERETSMPLPLEAVRLNYAKDEFQRAKNVLTFFNKKLIDSDQKIVNHLLQTADSILERESKITSSDVGLTVLQKTSVVSKAAQAITNAGNLLIQKQNENPLSETTKNELRKIDGKLSDILDPIFLDTPEKTSTVPQTPSVPRNSRTTATTTGTDITTANKADLAAKLDDAEATVGAALWSMFGSGGVFGSGVVVGAVFLGLGVAIGPIGWGILGGIAAVGLVGLTVSAVVGYVAEKKADAIEKQIGEISPDGRGFPDVSHVELPKPAAVPQAPSDGPSRTKNEPTGGSPVETPGMRQ